MRYENKTFDEERALYGIRDAEVFNCSFAGSADGESALKESGNIRIRDCRFLLRYPLWHVDGGELSDCVMTDTCRAALWYDKDLRIENSSLGGIKALRECDNSVLKDCDIESPEFGWFCRGIKLSSCSIRSEYLFLHSRDLDISALILNGKYSFQYVENMTIRNSELNTKDAFWHSRNVTVIDSVIKGEYLAWYSENLKLIRCTIIGTQPLCYAKNLTLEDCEMIDCDLSFEKSDVQVSVRGTITSVKNPRSGSITADVIGEIIRDEYGSPDDFCLIEKRESGDNAREHS
ncbi:MAG: DUF3737 family protein [Spirochaetota bacterium]